MNRIKQSVIALTVGAAALAAAPFAYADRYVENNYYYDHATHRDYDRDRHYDDRHDYGRHYGKKSHHRRHGDRHDPRHCRVETHHHYYNDAPRRVVVEQPRYRYHEPARVDYHREYESATPMIVGGILGGLIGNEMGKGRGRDAATVAGVILGGSIGRDMGRDRY